VWFEDARPHGVFFLVFFNFLLIIILLVKFILVVVDSFESTPSQANGL